MSVFDQGGTADVLPLLHGGFLIVRYTRAPGSQMPTEVLSSYC